EEPIVREDAYTDNQCGCDSPLDHPAVSRRDSRGRLRRNDRSPISSLFERLATRYALVGVILEQKRASRREVAGQIFGNQFLKIVAVSDLIDARSGRAGRRVLN